MIKKLYEKQTHNNQQFQSTRRNNNATTNVELEPKQISWRYFVARAI